MSTTRLDAALRALFHGVRTGAVASLVFACGCAPPDTALTREPLVSPFRHAEILTEAAQLEFPPSVGGNRLVAGWWPWRRDDETAFISVGDNVRLEIVHIAGSARVLVLDGEVRAAPSEARLRVTADDRFLGSFDLGFPIEISLPPDLPLGRVPIDLALGPESEIALSRAEIHDAAAPGEASIEEDAILQSGFSLIDYVVEAPPDSRLETTFQPPSDPGQDQRFSIWIEREGDESQEVFSWHPSFWNGLRNDFPVRAELGDGLVRIRFVALGSGDPGRWDRPTLATTATETSSPATTPATPDPPKLVLVYVMDALRADFLGHLGGPVESSPTLDRLAAEGVTLPDHYSVAPNTFPSIKSLFLGRTPRFDGGWKLPPDGPTTLAERFRSAGYRTALFSGNGLASPIYGTDRGFDYVAEDVVMHGLGPAGYSDNGAVVQNAFFDWLDSVPAEDRIFAYLQTLHPHNPYSPPADLERRFTAGIDSTIDGATSTLRDIIHGRLEPTASDKERLRALYTASIRYNDDLIAELLDRLGGRFAPGEVLIIVTSDHGDELFDHGTVLHGYTLYEEQIHVPLVLWWPGTIAPCRLGTPSDHLDLHYTLRALLDGEARHEWTGRSLWSEILTCRSEVDGHHLRFAAASSVKGGIFMARSGSWKYIWAPRTGRDYGQGGGRGRSRDVESLFNLESDPAERHNLAGDRSLTADWLRAELRAWVDNDPAETEPQEEATLDERERQRLRALGYLD